MIGTILLVVTIVGIPLLVLVPVVLLGAGLVMVLGFTGAAQGVGGLLFGDGRRSLFVLFWAGLLLVMLPTLFGESLALVGGPLGFVALLLGITGFAVEYLAWTTGMGAVILNQFGGALPVAPPPVPETPTPPDVEPAPPESGPDLPLAPSPPDD